MRFIVPNGRISITLINAYPGEYGKTKYDIRIFKKTLYDTKKVIVSDYQTHTLKYKAEKEAARMITGMAEEYLDGREEFKDVYDELHAILTDDEIHDIYECCDDEE
jgi:hypothetical protein